VPVRIEGLAYGFRFAHQGWVELEAPSELVVRITSPAHRELVVRPRHQGQNIRDKSAGGRSVCTFTYGRPRGRFRAIALRLARSVGDGRFARERSLTKIAAGMATLRFSLTSIDVVVGDHTASSPTAPDAPLAP